MYKEGGHTVAEVECTKCHKIKHIRPNYLFDEKYNSCSCQLLKYKNLEHKDKLYSIHANMKYRCNNENCHAYKDYGGRGIKVCEEWNNIENGFKNFYKWAISTGYKDGLSIDRIDNDKGYSPENCRWISLSENVAKANKHNVRRKPNHKGFYIGYCPSGKFYVFDNANEFSRQFPDLNANCIRQVANGEKKSHRGWSFGFIENIDISNIKPLSTIERII